MKKILIYSIAFLLSSFSFYAHSQDAYTLIGAMPNCASQSDFINTTTDLYQVISCGTDGSQLYVSNGTEPLHLLKRIDPGSSGANPGNFKPVGNKLFFTARNDDNENMELWITDGTEAGTQMVRDICIGSCGSFPSFLTEMNGIVYFEAYSSTLGNELWRSDGTTNGTYPIIDLYVGTNGGLYNDRDIYAHANTLYFCGSSSTNHYTDELYKTDGTESGTVLVKDINKTLFPNSPSGATESSFPNYFIALGDVILFSADDGINGAELWKTDGTEAGTVMVKDINPGSADSKPFASEDYFNTHILYNNEIYFPADDGAHGCELWKTDGTEAGTVLVAETNLYPVGQYEKSNGNPCYMTLYKDKLYFAAYSAPQKYNGYQVWQTDGTSQGTTLTTSYSSAAFPYALTACNDLLYIRIAYNATDILMKYNSVEVDTVTNKTNHDKYLTGNSTPLCFNNNLYSVGYGSTTGFGFWEIAGNTSIPTAIEKPAGTDDTKYIVSSSQLEILTPYTISDIRIISSSGNEIKVNRINENTFDISALSNGMYIVKINTDKKILTKKIILAN